MEAMKWSKLILSLFEIGSSMNVLFMLSSAVRKEKMDCFALLLNCSERCEQLASREISVLWENYDRGKR